MITCCYRSKEKKKKKKPYSKRVCFVGLPPAVLLLYWVGLPPAVPGSSVLSKGVETGLTRTQIGPVCVQIRPRLLGAWLRQVELF